MPRLNQNAAASTRSLLRQRLGSIDRTRGATMRGMVTPRDGNTKDENGLPAFGKHAIGVEENRTRLVDDLGPATGHDLLEEWL